MKTNVLTYSASNQANFTNALKELGGYETFTTFYSDLSIAEFFDIAKKNTEFESVKDTHKRVMTEWKSDIKYMTEYSMALNHKIWQHYETNEPLARVYNDLWEITCEFIETNFKGEDLQYYYSTTD